MIKLEVEPYCQKCLDFTPEVIKPSRMDLDYTDTVIHCKYRRRCEGIKRFLDAQLKGEASG